ncbi:uncharacterized protein LOC141494720 [Macrotis lagotis]|uniref:uncharacterized protein LOC141494720 n=1 Tax=Macrotis lagotis TaxID=92651 RepID=UPI003D69968B
MTNREYEIQDTIFPRHNILPKHHAARHSGLGRCPFAFWLAVSFDLVGLAVLLTGVFSEVFFYDLLLYAGSIIIFLSLIWWVFWYTGNVEAPPDNFLLPSKRLHLRSSSYLHSIRNSFSHRFNFSKKRPIRKHNRVPRPFTLNMVDTLPETSQTESPHPKSLLEDLRPENLPLEKLQLEDLGSDSPQSENPNQKVPIKKPCHKISRQKSSSQEISNQ